jgi:peptide chain release factor 1
MDINKARELLEKEALSVQSLDEDINLLQKELEKIQDYGSAEYADLSKDLAEKAEIKHVVEKLGKDIAALKEAESLSESDEDDYHELAQSEIERLTKDINHATEYLEEVTQNPLPFDNNPAIFEIRPGVGGSEAALFADEIFRMYTRYINSLGMQIDQYSINYEESGGIKESIFLVESSGSFGIFRFESGVHRVQRVPVTESSGRIHTSTASVVILPKIDSKEVAIKQEDLRIDVFRSSGPGGQSVNTTDSAVRITHLPTGIVVSCQNGKSQHKNKEIALSVLMAKLSQIELEKKLKQEKSMRQASILGGDRSAKIRTYNFPQGRITDHRINQSWFNIDGAMNGEIDEIVSTVRKELRSQLED